MSDSPFALTVARQGLGSVSSQQLNTYVQSCGTGAVLRTFTGLDGMLVALEDQQNLSGGFGFFVYNSLSTASDNGNTVIAPTGSTQGRWLRLSAGGGGGGGGLSGQLITTSPSSLAMYVGYGVKTSTGPITVLLPPLSSVTPGSWVDLYDMDWNANANNVTVDAAGADTIALFAGSAPTQPINIAGFRARLVANTANWRLLV